MPNSNLLAIRAPKLHEVDRLCNFAKQCFFESYVSDFPKEKYLKELVDKWFNPALVKNELSDFLVNYFFAFDQFKNLVGFAKTQLDMNYSSKIVLSKLYVARQYQGMGYGKQILDYIINWSRQDELCLDVKQSNKPAIEFYKKQGFYVNSALDYPLDFSDGVHMDVPHYEMKKSITLNHGFLNTVTPLSSAQKKEVIDWLGWENFDNQSLLHALHKAILDGCQFPPKIREKISALQNVYQLHQHNPPMKELLLKTIDSYVDTEGLDDFYLCCSFRANFNPSDWHSDLLQCLIQELKIPVKSEPVIQVAMHYGRIIWRLVSANEIIYVSDKNFVFNDSNSWLMTWEKFSRFKNSGKRSGTAEITKERFQQAFDDKHKERAPYIWEELKSLGVIDHKSRLTGNWRVLTNTGLLLHSLTYPDFFEKKEIKSVLEPIKSSKRDNTCSRNRFVQSFPVSKQIRAGLIWDYLKRNQVIDSRGVVRTLQYSINLKQYEKVEYRCVSDAIYRIMDNPAYQVRELNLSSFTYSRPERARKKWQSTGNVENTASDLHAGVKPWDVSIYHDLNNCRQTSKNLNSSLNYDHVPSKDFLTKKSMDLLLEYKENIKELSKTAEELEQKIKTKIDDLVRYNKPVVVMVEENEKSFFDSELNYWDTTLKKCKKEINILEATMLQVETEMEVAKKGHGQQWWTIAIPDKLHRQGETFMVSSNNQNGTNENSFLKDVSGYFSILQQRSSDFGIDFCQDFIKILGAFRYLYRSQVKEYPKIIPNHSGEIGVVPTMLFKNPKELQEVDQIFCDHARVYMRKTEGLFK